MKIDVLDHGYVRHIDTMGSDLSVVNAARVSYDKEVEEMSLGDEKLLRYLWKNGHTSPFRHAVLSFEVYAPLMVARQWYKHAVASTHLDDQSGWNESSRRYVTEREQFYIPKPSEWRGKPENSKQGSSKLPITCNPVAYTENLTHYVYEGAALYRRMMAEGMAPEQARLFLPAYAMYVRWRWTPSLHAVLNFLELRQEHTSQYEIQQYADAVSAIVADQFPITYKVALDESS